MSSQEFIASGILESYVLGITTEQENREVEQFASQYPEVRAEITAIEDSLGRMAEKFERKPAENIKENIFARIRELEKQEPETTGKMISMPVQQTVPENHFSWWVAAAVTLLLVSSGINVLLYTRWKSAEKELATLSGEKEMLADQYKIEKASFDQTARDLAILQQPGNKAITLKGSKIAPDAAAMVYWNNQTHEVYLSVSTLPLAPADKQYQLWAIVDGKPVDAGMIPVDLTDSSLHKMRTFENAQAFAITLEKKGGSPTPNLEALYVIGNV